MDEFMILMLLFLKGQESGDRFLKNISELIDKRSRKILSIIYIILENEDLSTIFTQLKEQNSKQAEAVLHLYYMMKLSFYNRGFIITQYNRLKDLIPSSQIEEFVEVGKELEKELYKTFKEQDDKDKTEGVFSVLLLDKFQDLEEDNLIGLGLFTGVGGLSGSGKTTFATNLILDIIANNDDIYIYYFGTNEIDEFDMTLKIGSILLAENLLYLDKTIKKGEKELDMIKSRYSLITKGNLSESVDKNIDLVINKIVKGSLSLEERINSSLEMRAILKKEIDEKKAIIEKEISDQGKKLLMELIEEKHKLLQKEEERLEDAQELLEKFSKIKNEQTIQGKIKMFFEVFEEILEGIKEKEDKIQKLKVKFDRQIEILKKQSLFKKIQIFINEDKIEIEKIERELKKAISKGRKVFFMIDYMQLLGSKKVFRNDIEQQEYIGLKLLNMSSKYKDKAGFLVFGQFKEKQGNQKSDEYTHDDVYGFKKIVHNFSGFLSLSNSERFLKSSERDHNKRPISKVTSTKNRHGTGATWKTYYYSFIRNIGKMEAINKNFYNILKTDKDIVYREDLNNYEKIAGLRDKKDEKKEDKKDEKNTNKEEVNENKPDKKEEKSNVGINNIVSDIKSKGSEKVEIDLF